MKVEAVTPTADASSPAHPDHDRWVKDYTLKMEADHAKRLGLSFRDAEDENNRQLVRSEAIAKAAPQRAATPPRTDSKPPREGHADRVAKRGVLKRPPKRRVVGAQLSPCGRCGTCRRCKREKRVFLMTQKAKAGDLKYVVILWNLGIYAQQAKDGTGPFVGIKPRDANRMVIRKLEDVCDGTVPSLGPWL